MNVGELRPLWPQRVVRSEDLRGFFQDDTGFTLDELRADLDKYADPYVDHN